MTDILERPLTFTVLNTAIAGAITIVIGAGFFDRTVLVSGITGIATGLSVSFTLLYLRQADATRK